METSSFLTDNNLVWTTQLAGHLTYGPVGKKIKNNIEKVVKEYFEKDGFLEIETPLILHKDVLIKSGHWDKFKDPIIKYKEGEKIKSIRLDKLWEEESKDDFFKQSPKLIYEWLKKKNISMKNECRFPYLCHP